MSYVFSQAVNALQLGSIYALVALGYGQSDAAVAVGQMEPGLSVDEMIRRALRQLAANL